MEFEKEGTYYAAWHIKEDLSKEKSSLIDLLYKGSIDGFYGSPNNMTPDETIAVTLRIEEITRILDAIRLGYYKAP